MLVKWKSKVFIVVLFLGIISFILSIICVNFFADKTHYEAEVSAPSFAPVIISKLGVLNAVSNEVKITAIGEKNRRVQLAVGRFEDVKDYANYDSTAYAEINKFKNAHSLGYILYNVNHKSSKPINLRSDMWYFYAEGKTNTSLVWNKKKSDDYSLIAVTDGKLSAPKIVFEWKVEPYSPYALPLFVLGILLTLVGIFGFFFNECKNIFIAFVVTPIKDRIEFNKALTKVDDLKVSQIQAYAKEQELNDKNSGNVNLEENDVTDGKRYPSRRELRKQEKRRK